MATFSKTLSGDSRYSITLTVTESIPSDYISTNKTNVTYNLTATKSSGSGYWDNVVQNPVRVVINGSTVVNKTISYDFTGSTPKTITLASGTVTGISHNADGSKTIAVSGYFQDIDNGLGSATASGNLTLTKIPRQANLSTAQDFNDEGNPTITYTNSAGNAVTSLQARIENAAGTASYVDYRDVNKTGTLSYTFNLTTAERNTLRNATPNSNSLTVKFVLKTVIGGNTYYSTMNKTMTIVNGNPTFDNFTFEDTDSATLALTGNNQYCILGYSNIEAIISTANKATANKGATMNKYQFVCGNTTKDISYSSSAEVNGTIDNVSSGTFTVYAIDSRGNSKSVSKTASSIISYSNIYLNANNSYLERDNSGVGGNVTLHYEGTFWNGNFGSATNSITSISYSYKKTTDSNYTTGSTNITPIISENNLSFTGLIAGPGTGYTFDVNSAYNIRIVIRDELSSYTLNLILNSGKPNIAYADDGVAIMGDYDENLGGELQVNGSLNASTLKEKNYQITPININGSTSTLLSRVQGLAQNNIYEATWFTITDGGSSGISDKPTGSKNAGFTCTAICNRYASSNDWRYVLTAYVQNDKREYIAIVQTSTSSISWSRKDVYSTSEVVAGTWTNGKTLYKKTINRTTTSGTISYIAKSDISSNLETIIRFEGRVIQPTGNITNVPYYAGNADKCDIWWRDNESRIIVRPGSTAGYGNMDLTIYYTKTTD